MYIRNRRVTRELALWSASVGIVGLLAVGTLIVGVVLWRGGPTTAAGPVTDPSQSPSAAASATLRPPGTPRPRPTPVTSRIPSTPVPVIGDPTPTPSAPPSTAPTPAPATPAPPTPAPTAAAEAPPLSACPIFPSSNVWNRRVDNLPKAANSDTMIEAIGVERGLHPDFSAEGGFGIPYNVVGSATAGTKVSFEYADESDPIEYPIPARPRIEDGGDRHLIVVDTDECRLYELFDARRTTSGWSAGSGASWDLFSNRLRPDGWTSADAAGLPIFPGLVRYGEVAGGEIRHALRFTAPRTCAGYIYPARHEAGSGSCATNPPMGLRVRLKASVDISKYGAQARVVLTALKRYGMILADNGSPWYVTGAPHANWNDAALGELGGVFGEDFEVVDTSSLVNG